MNIGPVELTIDEELSPDGRLHVFVNAPGPTGFALAMALDRAHALSIAAQIVRPFQIADEAAKKKGPPQ